MLIERQIKQYRALDEWFESPLGLFTAHEFALHLELEKESLYGDTLLQLGNCSGNLWLKKLHFNHKWVASPVALTNTIDLKCLLNQLPISANSVDCVLAPLVLEPFGNSLNLIDEIDRILKPMGFIVLFSINPWSIWSLAIKFGVLHCYAERTIKMRTPFHINYIFSQRGYRQHSLSNFCYIPPVTRRSLIKKLTFLDEIGKMFWPLPSAFYCYIAQKHQLIEPSLHTWPLTKTYIPKILGNASF